MPGGRHRRGPAEAEGRESCEAAGSGLRERAGSRAAEVMSSGAERGPPGALTRALTPAGGARAKGQDRNANGSG